MEMSSNGALGFCSCKEADSFAAAGFPEFICSGDATWESAPVSSTITVFAGCGICML